MNRAKYERLIIKAFINTDVLKIRKLRKPGWYIEKALLAGEYVDLHFCKPARKLNDIEKQLATTPKYRIGDIVIFRDSRHFLQGKIIGAEYFNLWRYWLSTQKGEAVRKEEEIISIK